MVQTRGAGGGKSSGIMHKTKHLRPSGSSLITGLPGEEEDLDCVRGKHGRISC